MKRYKHADLLKRWLDGESVQQRRVTDENREHDLGWLNVETIDDWVLTDGWEYRITPTAPLIDEETRKAIKRIHPKLKGVTMDANGCAYGHQGQVWENGDGFSRSGCYTRLEGLDNYAPDWRTSLVDLNEEVR